MPYQFDYYKAPLNDTIASLMLRRGDVDAQRARDLGQINAQRIAQGGQIWGNAIQSIGQTIGQLPQQMMQAKAADQETQLRGLKLQEMQRGRAGEQALSGIMQGDQLPAGDTGPRQQSYLGADGLFDVPKITQALAQAGYGDKAADMVSSAERINDSVLKHQASEAQTAKDHAIMIGDTAAGALTMINAGTPIAEAIDTSAAPLLATKRVKPEEFDQIKQQLLRLPPDQQRVALTGLMDQAAKLDKGETLAEGAQRVDRYGRVVASGGPKPPTEASIAMDAAKGDPNANRAMGLLKPGPKRTEAEQELDAYAKSINKPDASALTYADRQVFETNKEKIRADATFQNHMRERQYDNAHPAPVKPADQGKLEQEYRTVLTRAMSSRSGGIGAEDAKVQQANHLLALLDQTFDPKTGTYNIPKVQQTELAMGLAKLVAPGGTVGIQMEREINQRTAKGDLAGALTYITGTPLNATTQDIAKMFKDSIERQGQVAEQNREGEMRYLRGLAPTELEEPRRTALEANSLNPLRMSRIIQSKQTGERKLQISTDGGKTWK